MKPLDRRQQKFIAAVAKGSTIKAAAKTAGVSQQTAHNWLKKPEIKAALEDATVAARRGQIRLVEATAAAAPRPDRLHQRLAEAGSKAIELLIEVVENPEARTGDRIKAASELIRVSCVLEMQKAWVSRDEKDDQPKGKPGLSDEAAALIRAKILGVGDG